MSFIINLRKVICFAVPILFLIVIFMVSSNIKTNPKVVNTNINTASLPTIIIDAGHGGFDGGTSTKDGVLEKDINLNISKYLNEYLKALDIKTVLIRSTDTSVEDNGLKTIRSRKASDIHNRMKIMEKTPNSIFVSIHQNHFSEEKYKGLQVFYSRNYKDNSSLLAKCIQSKSKIFLDKNNNRQIKECGSSVYLIYNAVKPAILVECGFLSNKNESDLLKTKKYQKKVAMTIALGIVDYIEGMKVYG